MSKRCTVCHASGRELECCPDRPVFCERHAAEHHQSVHGTAPTGRTVDEALLAALESEGFDD